MKKGFIELTEEEANTLIELINIANKATGLQTAQAAVYFKDLIVKAFEVKDKVEETKDSIEQLDN